MAIVPAHFPLPANPDHPDSGLHYPGIFASRADERSAQMAASIYWRGVLDAEGNAVPETVVLRMLEHERELRHRAALHSSVLWLVLWAPLLWACLYAFAIFVIRESMR